MLLAIKDGTNTPQTVTAQSQQTPADRSGTITASNTSQSLMPANPTRSGWLIQNISGDVMSVNDLGGDATAANSIILPPFQSFPPPGYPITTGIINVAGLIGDAFVAREW